MPVKGMALTLISSPALLPNPNILLEGVAWEGTPKVRRFFCSTSFPAATNLWPPPSGVAQALLDLQFGEDAQGTLKGGLSLKLPGGSPRLRYVSFFPGNSTYLVYLGWALRWLKVTQVWRGQIPHLYKHTSLLQPMNKYPGRVLQWVSFCDHGQ